MPSPQSLPFLQLLKSLHKDYTLTQHFPFVYGLISKMTVKIFDNGNGILPTEDSLHSPYRWSDKLLSDYLTVKHEVSLVPMPCLLVYWFWTICKHTTCQEHQDKNASKHIKLKGLSLFLLFLFYFRSVCFYILFSFFA